MGERRVLVNGREVAVPERPIAARDLRNRAGADGARALVEVLDAGTMRQLSDDEVIEPDAERVYVNVPVFGYGS